MRVRCFTVQGYKNLSAPLILDELPPVVVLHGDNNVGKSNLLEALTLSFQLLALKSAQDPSDSTDLLITPGDVVALSEVFALGSPYPPPIHLSLSLEVSRQGWAHASASMPWSAWAWQAPTVEVALTLTPHPKGAMLKVAPLSFHAEATAAFTQATANVIQSYFLRWLTQAGAGPARAVQLLNVHRLLMGSQDAPRHREIIPQELLLKLYDAKESLDPEEHARWTLLAEGVATFRDLLGEGALMAVYDRRSEQAQLVWQHSGHRVPLHLLGSGVQQIVGLVGQLLMSGANILAIEEPEMNLRYTHQIRLRQLLRQIVADPRGPAQLFLTSHSPAFEEEGYFFALERVDGAVQVSRRPAHQAPQFTEHAQSPSPGSGPAPLSYVTSEGLVCLPTHVREALNLVQGGGVVFHNTVPGHTEMWTNAAYLDALGGEEE